MTEGKGFFESLLDFSFRECVTARNLAFIYGLHLLAGLIAAVVLVVNGFRDSTSQGLLMLVVSVAGFFSGPCTCASSSTLCWPSLKSPRLPRSHPNGANRSHQTFGLWRVPSLFLRGMTISV